MSPSLKVFLYFTSNSRLYPYFPSSSLALAGELLRAGYEPVIIDAALEDWRAYDVRDALCACISTFTGPWLGTAMDIASHVRAAAPGMKIFWGGPHVIALPEVTARHPLVDAACYTEGETVIRDLVNAVRDGRGLAEVAGIVYRDAAGALTRTPQPAAVNLDDISLPPYELLNMSLYPIKGGRIYYQSSRGCPYRCRFCMCENRNTWRGMTPEKVVGDLTKIAALFHPDEVQFFDGNFFASTERVRSILNGTIAAGLTFRWSSFCRFDTISRLTGADMALLRDSGCVELKFGGESASPEILAYIDKDTKPEYILAGVRRCREYGIMPTLSFMTGFPIEKDEHLAETLTLIRQIRKEYPYPASAMNGLFMLQHLPGTPLTEEVKKDFGIRQPETLEAWIRHQTVWTSRSDYPWLSRTQYGYRKTLSSIMSYLYLSDLITAMPESQRKGTPLKSDILFALFKLVNTLVRTVFVRLRWDIGITAFPVEWRIWDFIRERFIRMC